MEQGKYLMFLFLYNFKLQTILRPRRESHSRIFLLQRNALLLGYVAVLCRDSHRLGKWNHAKPDCVLRRGLEPPWVTPLAPKASASTNFATPA